MYHINNNHRHNKNVATMIITVLITITHSIDHHHLICSNKCIIVKEHLIAHCTISFNDTEIKWGFITPYLEGVGMEIDYNGQYFMRKEYHERDDRFINKSGKGTCSRGRI